MTCWDRVLGFVEKEINKGRQAYVICPLIEESEKLDVQNAIDLHSMLTHHYQGNVKLINAWKIIISRKRRDNGTI